MDKNILTRNLLILHQLREIMEAFSRERINVILLKGISLIELIPEYAAERVMDDIDLLIRPDTMARTRQVLNTLGYAALPHDPGNYWSPAQPASVDISDTIWYLNAAETALLWDEKIPAGSEFPHAFHLPVDELYIFIIAHAAVHHGMKEKTWLRDLSLIKEKRGNTIEWNIVEEKLAHYGLSTAAGAYLSQKKTNRIYRFFLFHAIPLKGHLLRFFFLPLRKKIPYLLAALFPSEDFLVHRYNLKNRAQVLLYSFLRPAFLLYKLASIPFIYLYHLVIA